MKKQKFKKAETLQNEVVKNIRDKNVVFLEPNSAGTRINILKTDNTGKTILREEITNSKALEEKIKNSILVGWSISDFIKTNDFLKTGNVNLDGFYCFSIKNMCKDAFLNPEYANIKNENKINLLKMKVTYDNVTKKYFGLTSTSDYLNNYKFIFFEILDFYIKNKCQENLERAEVLEVWYWNGYNQYQSGWQVKTNLGMFNYRTKYKAWSSKDVDIQDINIENLENQIWQKYNIGKFEFAHMKKDRYEKVKKELKINAS